MAEQAVDPAVAEDLQRDFGYVPDTQNGEQWVVYGDNWLVVVHPERRPRIYNRGCGGAYYEIEPNI